MQLKRVSKILFSLSGVILLTACGSIKSGESVSYAVWNESRTVIYSAKLVSNDQSRKILDGSDPGLIYQPLPKGAEGWNGLGGISVPQDVGHRVPERAQLSWRLPAKVGQKEWAGDLVGPLDIEIRAKIPEHVLKRVKGSRDAKLAIGVSAGVQPIKLRWVLKEATFVDGRREGGWRNVERGGDW